MIYRCISLVTFRVKYPYTRTCGRCINRNHGYNNIIRYYSVHGGSGYKRLKSHDRRGARCGWAMPDSDIGRCLRGVFMCAYTHVLMVKM